MDPMLISVAAFVGVAALVAAVYVLSRDLRPTKVEDRLEVLAGMKAGEGEARAIIKEDLLKLGKEGIAGAMGRLAERFGNIGLVFEQADSPITLQTFAFISMAMFLVGVICGLIGKSPTPLLPIFGLCTASFPAIWIWWRRRGRFKAFNKQLPDALELVARALRSGHSLSSGLHMVVEEMPNPISMEFSMAYEEQNLGVPIEQALKKMLRRMPNLDLKFFVTAVAIQRQTGGDLAEILDKIGYVVRERFKIMGTVQALTGEGRLSGAVLMAMPIAIFFAVYYLNSDYVMLLFTEPLGRKMIAVGAFMQILGAVSIKKIIDIKV